MGHRHLSLAAWVLGALVALPAVAQDDASRAGREREALRRTQAALRDAQAQQSALAREKAELAGERDKLDETARRSQSQLSASRAEASRLNATLAKADDELAAAKAQQEAARKDADARIADLGQQLAQARRLADERAKANAVLVALLERATRSLATAEKANRDMHALGVQMIDLIRGKSVLSGGTPVDPVLGFGQIRLENEAEDLRDKLDAVQTANAAKSASAAR